MTRDGVPGKLKLQSRASEGRSGNVLRPFAIFRLHRARLKRKYRLLFTPKTRGKPGTIRTTGDLEKKLLLYKKYRNKDRSHQELDCALQAS